MSQKSAEERERLQQRRREQGQRLRAMAEKRRAERILALEEQLNTYVELLDETATATASETAVFHGLACVESLI